MIQSIYKILPKRFYRKYLKPKIYPYFVFLKKRERNSGIELDFIKKLNRYKIQWQSQNKNIVLTQIIEDHAYAIKLAACSHHIAKKESANIALYDAESRIEWNPDYNYKKWNRFFTEKYTTRLDKIFLSFAGKVVFRNSNLFSNQALVRETYSKIKSNISSKEDILKIEIEGVVLGDLIYDTYLRFASKPTVNIEDPYLDKIIIESINIYFNCKKTLEIYTIDRPIGVVVSNCSFIEIKSTPLFCNNSRVDEKSATFLLIRSNL